MGFQRGQHPNSRRNLRPAQPGDVLNPKGNNQHTYRTAFETQVQQILDEPHEEFPGKTKREVLARVLIDNALAGKPWAMQLVMKRLWSERSEVELVQPPQEQPLNLSKLTQEELDQLEEMAERVLL